MRPVVLVAGVLLLIAGIAQLYAAMRSRARGNPWHGIALMAIALALYGVLTLSGVVFNGTVLSAVLVWLIAGAMWCGWWLQRRGKARDVR